MMVSSKKTGGLDTIKKGKSHEKQSIGCVIVFVLPGRDGCGQMGSF
jgi:hypothetical protein